MSRFIAVVPPHIARKWNAIALQQLCEAASRLTDELIEERRWRAIAEDQADMWERIAEIREHGDDVGLTVNGHVVPVPPQASAS